MLWIGPVVAITIGLLAGARWSRSIEAYSDALEAWHHRANLYVPAGETVSGGAEPMRYDTVALGFLYPPSFIPLYAPLSFLPAPWGDIVFRLTGCLAMACMLGVLMRTQGRTWQPFDYALLSLLTVPVSLGAVQTGQANTLLASVLLVACWGIQMKKPVVVGVCLAIGLAMKPFMMAPAGLAALILPSCVVPMILAMALLVGLPLLTAPAPYVIEQYLSFVHHITGPCLHVMKDRFADINGLMRGIGWSLDGAWSTGIRTAIGIVLAGWIFRSRRRWSGADLSLLWLGASSAYLMLFNPMTEANSYCMLAIPLGLFAWRWIGGGRPLMGWAFAAALLLMGFGSEILRPLVSHQAGSKFDLRFMPLTAVAFMVALIRLGVPNKRHRSANATTEHTANGF